MSYEFAATEHEAAFSIPVIDCHHHVGNVQPHEWRTSEWRAQDQAERAEFMVQNQIDRCVIMPMPLMTLVHTNEMYAAAHDMLSLYRTDRPDLVVGACCTVNPAEPATAEVELARCFGELGFVGVSFHHRYLGLTVNDDRMSVVMEAAQAFGRVVLVHILAESADMESPWRLFSLARRYPEVRFVALDGFSSPTQASHLIDVAGDFPNIWFDTGVATAVAHGFALFVEKWGPDRLVIGTDTYSGPKNFYTAFPVQEIRAIGFTREDLARISYRNAAELFQLNLG